MRSKLAALKHRLTFFINNSILVEGEGGGGGEEVSGVGRKNDRIEERNLRGGRTDPGITKVQVARDVLSAL